MAKEKPLDVRSMYGHHTQKGLVVLRLGEEMVQIEPDRAEEIAHWLISAAEAARSDEFIIKFIMGTVGLDERRAAQVLYEFRQMRGLPEHHADLEGA